jgi:hypothetical protein
MTQLCVEIRGALKKGTVREVRVALERRFVTFVFKREDSAVKVYPVLKRLAVYESWGQPVEGGEEAAHALVTLNPEQNGSDLWESLHAIPD